MNYVENGNANAKIVFATTAHMNPDGYIGINPRYNEGIEVA